MHKSAIVLLLFLILLTTACVPGSDTKTTVPLDPIASIGYEDINFDTTCSQFKQLYRGATMVNNAENTEHGIVQFAIQDHGLQESIVTFQFMGEQLMSIIFSHLPNHVMALGGIDALMKQTVAKFGTPTKSDQKSTRWIFPQEDRTITATTVDGMWVLGIERTSLGEQLQNKRFSAAKKKIGHESTPTDGREGVALSTSYSVEPTRNDVAKEPAPQSGWIFWKPTPEELAEIEAELAAERRASGAKSSFKASDPTYRIVEQEEFSLPGKRRYQLRIRVQNPIDERQIESICRKILSNHSQYTLAHAVEFLFYLPDSDHHGHFTAGKAIWGTWSTISPASTKKSLTITVGNALGERPNYETSTDLPVSKKKKIFLDIVEAQDTDMDPDLSYVIVAQRHGIDEKQAREIAQEGIYNGWPMP